MSRIYCDVCGTAYSEKETHCRNCGCARPIKESALEDAGTENSVYTYVKGGRFSKSNVRKRNQGKVFDDNSSVPEENREQPQENGERTDKGLVIAVCVLLLAIVAVVIYIVTRFFASGSVIGEPSGQDVQPSNNSVISTTVMPETTDTTVAPETEATVETTEEQTVPSSETQPTQVQNNYVKPYTLSTENRKNDVTLYRNYSFDLELHDATGELMDIEWVVADPEICSVEGNTVTGLKVGKTTVQVTIDDITYSCIVRVKA